MKIGIIVAMEKELNLLLPVINDVETLKFNDTTFYRGRLEGHEVIVLKSGIGKVNAAVGALTLIERFAPDMVINTGVAGGTGVSRVLDVIIPHRIAYHDVWCGPGTVPGQAAGCPLYFPCALSDDCIRELGAKTGLLASGDIFVSRPEEVEKILALYPDAVGVEMEAGAIAQVCMLKHIPFVCIRVISDTPGAEDNIAQYENFWDDAPASTFSMLGRVLSSLS